MFTLDRILRGDVLELEHDWGMANINLALAIPTVSRFIIILCTGFTRLLIVIIDASCTLCLLTPPGTFLYMTWEWLPVAQFWQGVAL